VAVRSAHQRSFAAAKQLVVGLNTTEATVAVVSQSNRVQLRLQKMNVRLQAMMRAREQLAG
jgi:hypothetical protein